MADTTRTATHSAETATRRQTATRRRAVTSKGAETRSLDLRLAEARPRAVQLVLWRDLPTWQQEGSGHIETGYRPASESLLDCLNSWRYLHNETVNIFSHAVGALVFLALPIYIFSASSTTPPRDAVATPADKIVCSIYFVGVAVCFAFSAAFHTFMHHSPSALHAGQRLDFYGIILLMWGANIPLVYYSFACAPALQARYWALTTVMAGLCGAATGRAAFHSPTPPISSPQLDKGVVLEQHGTAVLRAATFGLLGVASTFLPVAHGVLTHGAANHSERVGLPWVLATLVFNVAGAGAYAARVPERWWPRRFDVLGASHQVMHIAILVAGLCYGAGVVASFDYFHAHPEQCGAWA
ncbi:hemolysin-III related-domain-containing protein [Lasiosphaeria miniovina]|uniref:Hemolysin-III related-domain-containing protein n=1 Tax=Lasiosphaeria miniovina TaxID=1954250 RepID=A0AA40DTE5_9PEZI|nr:hemolysin-III related-domain-containing protein [Lasiosphaeria miniovina]KAK0712672.1 hemolysin-III related-domain-containing protein [Lasiosphaeria miniovina]